MLFATGLLQVVQPAAPRIIPNPEGRRIDAVRFEGAVSSDAAYLQTIVKIAPGAVWQREEIAAACTRLGDTGKFEGNPIAEAREEDGLLILVFVLKERPFVEEIDFVGNSKYKTSELLKDIELTIGSPVSEYLVNQAIQEVERKYREAGYYHIKVSVDRQVLEKEHRAIFQISEGPRVKVRKILFEGNLSYSPRKLKSLIETSTYIWLLRTGAYDDETVQRDEATLRKFYYDRGYLNARVSHKIDLADNQQDLTLTFLVKEELQYKIKALKLEGNHVFDEARLRGWIKSVEGQPLDADVLEADVKRLREEYGRIGYIYAKITPAHVFADEEGLVLLTIHIAEGGQFRFGRIQIRGNAKTKDKVVRRELRVYPEELYDSVETKAAEQRLKDTRLFSEATITPVGELPGVRDALVDVVEGETAQILFGVGVTSNNGLVGSITLEQRNFDIFDWPRNSTELFKGQAFRGAGQTMRLQLEPGTELTRGRIEFREPYLFDQDVGFGTGLYVFQRDRDDFEEERIGFYLSLDRRIKEGLLKGWTVEGASRFERVKISDVDWYAARDIQEVKGWSSLTSFKATLLRDRTDSLYLPSKGNKLKLSYEQAGTFGGDYTFGKALAEFEQYYTLYTDTFDRKHILQFGVTSGEIFGDAPVFERFYAGGIGSVRGFAFRGISPRAGVAHDAVGGDYLLLANTEYSFPVVGQLLRGVTFLDMGTVEDDFGLHDWRAAVGFGARIYIKYFGPIPLSFDLAWPIAKDDRDDTQVFNFSFGTTF